jgi:hypothetical protein
MEHAFPLFAYHLGETGCQAFFTYIEQNEQFYRRIIQYDDGEFLKKCGSSWVSVGRKQAQSKYSC